jgi:hypothetical protein
MSSKTTKKLEHPLDINDTCQSCQFVNIVNIARFILMCQNQKKENFIKNSLPKIKKNGKSNY